MATSNWDPWNYRQSAREPGDLRDTEETGRSTAAGGDTRDMDPSNRDMDPSNRDMDPSNRDMDPSNRDMDPSNRDMDPSNRDMDPSNRDMGTATTQGRDMTGFSVAATDGDIGKVDQNTVDVDTSYIVVDTGPWIFGRKVMLPAGTIERVDWDDKKVYVDRTKDQIKDSPELTDADLTDTDYRDRVGGYYGDTYRDKGL